MIKKSNSKIILKLREGVVLQIKKSIFDKFIKTSNVVEALG
jgi:hypothetical protein